MSLAKRKREDRGVDADLMPMIDVTFQLLIFFIVTMKIRQIEVHEKAQLPDNQGVRPNPGEDKDFILVRLFWQDGNMTYEVNAKHGNTEGKSPNAIHAGGLRALIESRSDPNQIHYKAIFEKLYRRVQRFSAIYDKAESFEIAFSSDTQRSSREQIDTTAPWGYVTLVLDVLTKFNYDREQKGERPFSVTFKNTEP